jgi:YggT family protein
MSNQLRKQELNQQIDRNIEQDQRINLSEKQEDIATADQNSFVARIVNIIYFLTSTLELLLATRVILHMLSANPNNGFTRFIYGLSSPFVALFTNLVQNPTWGNAGVFEVTTLIAMLVWGVVGVLVGRLVWLVLSRPR